MDFAFGQIVPFLEFFRNRFHAGRFRYFLGFMRACVGVRDRKRLTRLAADRPSRGRQAATAAFSVSTGGKAAGRVYLGVNMQPAKPTTMFKLRAVDRFLPLPSLSSRRIA